MPAAHSLNLPSISEEEDEEEEEEVDNDDDDSGSGSPPSSPSVGPVTSDRRATGDWTMRRKSLLGGEGAPLIPRPRPALRFAHKLKSNLSASSKTSSSDRDVAREKAELTRSSVERLDSQMSQMRQDMVRLTDELRGVTLMLQQLCTDSAAPRTEAVLPPLVPPSRPTADQCPTDDQQERGRCSLQQSSSNCQPCCQQLGSGVASPRPCARSAGSSHTRASQTECSLLDELLNKISDSGSPPPNSGYSSSSSNETTKLLMIGMQAQRNADDSETASDDSVLRASVPQTQAKSLDLSPSASSAAARRPARTAWSAVSVALPAPNAASARASVQATSRRALSETSQSCAIDMDEVSAGGSSSRQTDGPATSPSRRKLC